MEEVKIKHDMWIIISEIYDAVMRLKKARENYPEVFSDEWLNIWLGKNHISVDGGAIAPYKFKITPEGKWIDCTERELNVNDRNTK